MGEIDETLRSIFDTKPKTPAEGVLASIASIKRSVDKIKASKGAK